MYSQAWAPTSSTTAVAPEFLTANRSPARPAQKSSPPIARNRSFECTRTGANTATRLLGKNPNPFDCS
jgi:hypothetical protein